MSLVDLSLDEIIARKKTLGKGGASKGSDNAAGSSKRQIPQRGRGFSRKYESSDSAFIKSKNMPTGKWGHDGFDELYGNESRRAPRNSIRSGGRVFERTALTKKVKLLLTNLAPTVSTADLNELFENYPIDSVTVHFDETGKSTGTADVVTDRVSAEEIKNNFKGVALDDYRLHMFVIDESAETVKDDSILDRLSFSRNKRSRGINKPRSRPPPRAPEKRNRVGRPNRFPNERKKMTDAELDKELDEYMKKGASTAGASAKMEEA